MQRALPVSKGSLQTSHLVDENLPVSEVNLLKNESIVVTSFVLGDWFRFFFVLSCFFFTGSSIDTYRVPHSRLVWGVARQREYQDNKNVVEQVRSGGGACSFVGGNPWTWPATPPCHW